MKQASKDKHYQVVYVYLDSRSQFRVPEYYIPIGYTQRPHVKYPEVMEPVVVCIEEIP